MGILAAHPDQALPARSIADRLRAAEGTVAKALQRLVKNGLLRSVRGPRGGFLLAHPPEKITLLAIYEAVEGPYSPSDCLLSAPLCAGDDCVLGTLLKDVNHLLFERFRNTTLDKIGEIFEADRFRIDPR